MKQFFTLLIFVLLVQVASAQTPATLDGVETLNNKTLASPYVANLLGSSAASGTLTLMSTSSATKGKIIFGTSVYDEVNNRMGIGTAAPQNVLHVASNILTANTEVFPFRSSESTTAKGVVIGYYTNSAGTDVAESRIRSTGTVPLAIGTPTYPQAIYILNNTLGNIGIANLNPTARIHIGAGSATPSTAPLKFTSGTLMTIPEPGSVEFNGADLFYTNGSGARKTTTNLEDNQIFTGLKTFSNTTITNSIIPSITNAYTLGNTTFAYSSVYATNFLATSGSAATIGTAGPNSLVFSLGGVAAGRVFPSTGNWVLQNGGTAVDAGYKLDVVGTARVSGQLSLPQAAGIAPMLVTSNTVVANLNADMVDGAHASDFSRKVALTSAGIATDLNTWTKVLTINMGTNDHYDGNLLLAINGMNGAWGTTVISVGFRQYIVGQTPSMAVNIVSSSGGSAFGDDSFKMVTEGYNSDYTLYVKKTIAYGQFQITELSSKYRGGALTYFSNQGWSPIDPTGTYTAVSSGIRYQNGTGSYSIWHSGNLNNLNQLTTRNYSDLQNKPTTLAGLGVTDALPLSGGTLTGNLNGTSAIFTGIINSVKESSYGQMILSNYSSQFDYYRSDLNFRRARGTQAAPLSTAYNDWLGGVNFWSANSGGTFANPSATVVGIVDGTPGAAYTPGRLAFQTSDGTANPVDRMTIKNNGQVGIGTIAPITKLHIADATFLANTNSITIAGQPDFTYYYGIGGAGTTGSEGIGIWGGTQTVAKSPENPQFFVQRGGNVGIGNITPAYKLDVTGSTRVSSQLYVTGEGLFGGLVSTKNVATTGFGDASQLKLTTNATAQYGNDNSLVFAAGSANVAGIRGIYDRYNTPSASGGRLEFWTRTSETAITEAGRITNGGNWLINSTTDAGYKLDVNGTSRFQNKLTLATGTASSAPLSIPSGVLVTTPTAGNIESNGTSLYFTNSSAVRKTLLTLEDAPVFSGNLTAVALNTSQIIPATETVDAQNEWSNGIYLNSLSGSPYGTINGWNSNILSIATFKVSNIRGFQIASNTNNRFSIRSFHTSDGPRNQWNTIWTTADFGAGSLSNWNNAFGWGNHATAGYLKADINGDVLVGQNAGNISSSSPMFAGVKPKFEINTFKSGSVLPLEDAVVIRSSYTSATAGLKRLGLLLKMSSESNAGESNKSGGMILESSSVYSNDPELSLITSNTKRLSISSTGVISLPNMAGVGDRILSISSTGVLGISTDVVNTKTDQLILGTKNFFTGVYVGEKSNTTAVDPSVKLWVNGKIKTRSILVDPKNWADYVFDKDYQLASLRDIEAFIKINKHLPEVPTRAEVNANGVNVGEMNEILLKKVEELTLHLIEKDKQMSSQEERIKKLEDALLKLSEK